MKKIKLLSQRRLAMVGVNKYPNLMETISEDILYHQKRSDDQKLLVPQRAGVEIEKIRYKTEHFVSKKGFDQLLRL